MNTKHTQPLLKEGTRKGVYYDGQIEWGPGQGPTSEFEPADVELFNNLSQMIVPVVVRFMWDQGVGAAEANGTIPYDDGGGGTSPPPPPSPVSHWVLISSDPAKTFHYNSSIGYIIPETPRNLIGTPDGTSRNGWIDYNNISFVYSTSFQFYLIPVSGIPILTNSVDSPAHTWGDSFVNTYQLYIGSNPLDFFWTVDPYNTNPLPPPYF